ncbi:hypothetical protein C8R45DRAFT_996113 [Mycena sanguinolenta]|nr:hypothetical protein C8R45DRAFT_996113 [Mycena sanguinolenta]
MMKSSDFLLIVVAIICPPIATFLISGCGADLFISICLSIIGYLPGHIVCSFHFNLIFLGLRIGSARLLANLP